MTVVAQVVPHIDRLGVPVIRVENSLALPRKRVRSGADFGRE